MATNWKLSQDGLTASRTLDNGGMESRLCHAIDAEELALATPYTPEPAQLLAAFQQSAQAALSATDTTFARIQEAITLGLVPTADAAVVAWIEYRKALRVQIKATAVGALAVKPTTYPAGT